MLKVDYEALETAATTLADQGDTFEECISTMGSVIEGLPDIWEAETCTQYVADYNEAKQTLTDVRNLIKDMSEQMKKISANFKDADEDMKKQMM